MSLTDADIQKLKNSFKDTFATKDDFKGLDEQFKGLAQQKDLLIVQKNLSRVESKVDAVDKRVTSVESKVDTLQENFNELVGAVASIFEWTDDIHKAILGRLSRKTIS